MLYPNLQFKFDNGIYNSQGTLNNSDYRDADKDDNSESPGFPTIATPLRGAANKNQERLKHTMLIPNTSILQLKKMT